MRVGDASGPHVPAPRSSDGPAEAVPIGGRRGSIAVLDEVVVPPWLRMPSLRLVAEPCRPSTGTAPGRSTPGGRPVRGVSAGSPDRPASADAPDLPSAATGSSAPSVAAGSSLRSAPAGGSSGRSTPAASDGRPVATDPDRAPVRPVTELAARRATVRRPAVLSARPRVVEDTGILGLSRLTRGRLGSRLFTLFFVGVFTLIALQMVLELLHG